MKMRHFSKYNRILTIIFFLSIFSFSFSQDVPQPMNPPRLVNDYIGLLNETQRSSLESALVAFNDSTSTQIVVVIVNTLNGADPNYFAYKIGDSWKVGQKGKNNGIVFLIKPKNGNEKGQVAISVGYGLEHVMTDALSKRIIETEIIPYFRENKYYEGIVSGVKAIMLACRGQYKAEPKTEKIPASSWFAVAILFFFLFSFFLSIISSVGKRHNISSKGSRDLPFWIFWGSMMGGSGKDDWGSFSSGSGGFGGFGGGSFGGGGASGSW
jgi:uncharacterized protein